MSRLRANAGPLGAALLFAFGVKAFYASASADELAFVLGPTAALVSLLSGHRFEVEPGAGYLSRELAFVIAPACAGLNYFAIAFCTLVRGFAPRIQRPARRAAWLLGAAALAFGATLLVNAARIALAIELRAAQLPAWLSAAEAHRLEGVAVYLGSLWLLVAVVERCFARPLDAVRAVLLPLAPYLAVTLLLPALNGARERPEFWDHARVVLAAALALSLAVYVAVAASRRVAGPTASPRARRAQPRRAIPRRAPACRDPCA